MSSGQIRVPATYIRGGTSKGVFFNLRELPAAAQVPGAARDALLLRVIGSPTPTLSIPMVWAEPPPAPAKRSL